MEAQLINKPSLELLEKTALDCLTDIANSRFGAKATHSRVTAARLLLTYVERKRIQVIDSTNVLT